MSKKITEDGEIVDDICEDCPTVFFKTPYNHDRDVEAKRTALYCKDPSLTDQSFIEDADINTIINRAMRTGEMPVQLPPQYGDPGERLNMHDMYTRIAENNATFYKLPARIRNEYLNDPSRWGDQVLRDLAAGNVENLAKLGIEIDPESIPKAPEPPKAVTAPEGGQPPQTPPKGA